MRHAPYPITQRAPILTSPTSVAFGEMTAEGSTLGLWLPLFSSIGTPLAHFVSPNVPPRPHISIAVARSGGQPPKAVFVTRLRSGPSPSQTARQLPDLSTIIWVDSSSTGYPCLFEMFRIPCDCSIEVVHHVADVYRCWRCNWHESLQATLIHEDWNTGKALHFSMLDVTP